MGRLIDGHTRDRRAVSILNRHYPSSEPLSQHLFQPAGHGGASLACSYDIHVRITLQIIGYRINMQRVTLAHDRTLHCGNGINCSHPSGKDVPAILAEFLHSA
jgi:hypothetical protein